MVDFFRLVFRLDGIFRGCLESGGFWQQAFFLVGFLHDGFYPGGFFAQEAFCPGGLLPGGENLGGFCRIAIIHDPLNTHLLDEFYRDHAT